MDALKRGELRLRFSQLGAVFPLAKLCHRGGFVDAVAEHVM